MRLWVVDTTAPTRRRLPKPRPPLLHPYNLRSNSDRISDPINLVSAMLGSVTGTVPPTLLLRTTFALPDTSALPTAASASAPDPVAKAISDLACTVVVLSARHTHIESIPPPPPSPAATLPMIFPYGLPESMLDVSPTTLPSASAPLPIHHICMPSSQSPIPSYAMASAAAPAFITAGAPVISIDTISTAAAVGGASVLGGPSHHYLQGAGSSHGMGVDG